MAKPVTMLALKEKEKVMQEEIEKFRGIQRGWQLVLMVELQRL